MIYSLNNVFNDLTMFIDECKMILNFNNSSFEPILSNKSK